MRIDGLIASISPTKKGKSNFFDGELTDGQAVVQIVGFNQGQHDQLEQFLKKGLAVTLTNVQIQKNESQKLEIILKNHTKVEHSSEKFEVADVTTLGSNAISLAEVSAKEYECLTVKAKVIIMEPSETKQEIFIADGTATANLTVLENDVDNFDIGDCYQFNRLVVRFYRGKKHLCITVSIVKKEMFEPKEDQKFGKCSKCHVGQLLSQATLKPTAKLFLQSTV